MFIENITRWTFWKRRIWDEMSNDGASIKGGREGGRVHITGLQDLLCFVAVWIGTFHQINCGPSVLRPLYFLRFPFHSACSCFLVQHKDFSCRWQFRCSHACNPWLDWLITWSMRCRCWWRTWRCSASWRSCWCRPSWSLWSHPPSSAHKDKRVKYSVIHVLFMARDSVATVKLYRTETPEPRLTWGVSKNISLSSTVIL